jgi:hypothetical protein
MPVDQATAQSLAQILGRLRAGCDDIAALLPNAATTPTQDDKQKIEILQKYYSEISNYDRHYSSTRSALTVLLVTVGLVLATEPLKAMWARTSCIPSSAWAGIADLLNHFPITLLLFLLTFPVNLYFRRLTFACAILERAIEREIAVKSAIPVPGDMFIPNNIQNLAPPIGYYFRYDLGRVNRQIGWPRLDEMTLLLIFSVLEFIAILFYWEISACMFWRIYLYGVFVVPLVVVGILGRRWRNRPGHSLPPTT